MLLSTRHVYMAGERRGKYQIIHDILRCCNQPIRLTWLLALSNLTGRRAKRYLEFLLEKGLIVEKRTSRGRKCNKTYMITAEGRRVLRLLDELERVLG